MLSFIYSNVLGFEDEAAKNNRIRDASNTNGSNNSNKESSLAMSCDSLPPPTTQQTTTTTNNITNTRNTNINKSFTVPNSPEMMRTKKSFSFDVRNYPDNEACSPLSFAYALLARLNLDLQKEIEKNTFEDESELLDSLNAFVHGLQNDVKTSSKIQLPYREIIQQLIGSIDKYKSDREGLYIAGISSLLIFSRNAVSKNEIARVGGIAWVCSVMKTFQRSVGVQEWGCKLLGSMAICGLNVVKIADAGGIGLIIDGMLLHKFARSVNIEAWIALGNMAVTEGNEVFRRRITSYGGLGVIRQSLFIHANQVNVTGLCDKCVIARGETNPLSESNPILKTIIEEEESDQSVDSIGETEKNEKEKEKEKDKNGEEELCSVAAKHIVNILLTPCVHNQLLSDSRDKVFSNLQAGLGRRASTGFTIEMRNFSSPSLLMHSSME